MRYVAKVALAAMLAFSGAAQALPPQPGSQLDDEFSTLVEQIHIAGLSGLGDKVPPMVAKVAAKLDRACARNDALACSFIVIAERYYGRYPEPVNARRGFLAKAGSLYIQFCEAQPDLDKPCSDYHETLEDLAKDSTNAALAEGPQGLTALRLQLGRVLVKACALPTFMDRHGGLSEEEFDAALEKREETGIGYAESNCESGIKLLTELAPAEARVVRTSLCDRDKEEHCRAIGRLSASQLAEDKGNMDACTAGQAQGCLSVAMKWMYRKDFPNYGAETRAWSKRACDLDQPMGCFLLGAASVQTEYGAQDVATALAAFGKACKIGQEPQRAQACNIEKQIRDAIAEQAKPAGT